MVALDDAQLDGRSRRAARTRQVVVDTCLDLIAEGNEQPTALQISQRSGVSMSSVFRLFDDVEALHTLAIAEQTRRIAPLLVDIPAVGGIEVRAKRLVDSRAKLYEAITPVRRLALRLESASEPIQRDLEVANDFLRAQVAGLFAVDLSRMPREQAGVLLEAIDALTSWDTWFRLRMRQRLSVRRSKAVVQSSLLTLLATRPV
jgi:AcrR family transcriptional regulator